MPLLHISKDDGTETLHTAPRDIAYQLARIARYFDTDAAGVDLMFQELGGTVETCFSLYKLVDDADDEGDAYGPSGEPRENTGCQ